MKKIFTILTVIVVALNISAQSNKVKILYVTKEKLMDATAGSDTLLGILKVDSRLDVTVWSNAADSSFNVNEYDVIVMSEAPGSGDNVVKKLKGVDKPFLNMKIYAYKSGVWNFGTAADPNSSAPNNAAKFLAVKPGKANHPLLNGVTIANDKVQIFKRLSNDLGATGNKGLNYAHTLISAPSSLIDIGKPDTTISGQDDMTSLHMINDPSATWNGVPIKKPYICIGYNYGAICADGATNLTADGIKIFKNAVEILIAPFLTSVKENSSNQVNAYASKGEIRVFVESPSVVSIYSYDGRLIQKSIVNKQAYIPVKAGIYLINVAGIGTKKVVVNE